MILFPDFEDFIGLLNAHSVDYMVVGGYALAFHGKPRNTGDLDIWIEISEINLHLEDLRILLILGKSRKRTMKTINSPSKRKG
ncbi:hypothetical protein SAMN03080617_00433 [Algoriphagus alkaliphilus]|uniref:Nucleotidyltransferase domain-containing protein n=1 Tax=Algoriphagus alkaliphilus TaxID=279824 RepID=A0A1G5VC54_9BACT|nr:hypothetical protein [Cyclobacterium sp.]SDA43453.1 hypothetical protein SAMN03080617_00433 [Algoriphagus alkaliphilus]